MRGRVLASFGFLFILLIGLGVASAQCAPAGGDPSVTICSPTNGTTAPLRIVAATNSSAPVDLMQVFLNGHKRWEKAVSAMDIHLLAWSGGPYHITVKAHDTAGRWFQSSVDITAQNDAECPDINQPARTVTWCVPIDGEVIWTPYSIRSWYQPSTTGEYPRASQLYLDGVQIWESGYPYWPYGAQRVPVADQPLPLGLHRLTLQAYDSQGTYKSSVWVRVTSVSKACPLPAAQPAVEICGLNEGDTVSSPVRVRAAGNAKKGVWVMQIYVDRVKVYEDGHSYLDRMVEMTPGTHRLTVQARSGDLVWFNQTINITVQ
jgi:hypothetical protein